MEEIKFPKNADKKSIISAETFIEIWEGKYKNDSRYKQFYIVDMLSGPAVIFQNCIVEDFIEIDNKEMPNLKLKNSITGDFKVENSKTGDFVINNSKTGGFQINRLDVG